MTPVLVGTADFTVMADIVEAAEPSRRRAAWPAPQAYLNFR
jgi:hypothetical protein